MLEQGMVQRRQGAGSVVVSSTMCTRSPCSARLVRQLAPAMSLNRSRGSSYMNHSGQAISRLQMRLASLCGRTSMIE